MVTPQDIERFTERLEHALWQTERPTAAGSFSARWFGGQVARQVGIEQTVGEGDSDLVVVTADFLWNYVRLGILRPVSVAGGDKSAYDNSKFYFTPEGLHWQRQPFDSTSPFATDFETALKAECSIIQGEPCVLMIEARRAFQTGLRRACLFLVGLLNEDVTDKLFDAGLESGGVKDTNAKANRFLAFAKQRDVFEGMLAQQKAGNLSPGVADEWDALATAIRNYRNECAHSAAYIPDQSTVHSALFMLPRMARTAQAGFDALT
ncbi:MAG: hypothetical protein IPK87_03785 [Planctomycetes bacterium]|nr:hypothetical protein [Planctomycetota bacterium]